MAALKATKGNVSAGSPPYATAHFFIIQYESARERPVCLCLYFIDILSLFHPGTLPRSLCLRFRFRRALTFVLSPHRQSFHKPALLFPSLCVICYPPPHLCLFMRVQCLRAQKTSDFPLPSQVCTLVAGCCRSVVDFHAFFFVFLCHISIF